MGLVWFARIDSWVDQRFFCLGGGNVATCVQRVHVCVSASARGLNSEHIQGQEPSDSTMVHQACTYAVLCYYPIVAGNCDIIVDPFLSIPFPWYYVILEVKEQYMKLGEKFNEKCQ